MKYKISCAKTCSKGKNATQSPNNKKKINKKKNFFLRNFFSFSHYFLFKKNTLHKSYLITHKFSLSYYQFFHLGFPSHETNINVTAQSLNSFRLGITERELCPT